MMSWIRLTGVVRRSIAQGCRAASPVSCASQRVTVPGVSGPRQLSTQGGEQPSQSLARAPPTLPPEARVVICGGGVVGLSVAYHLAKRGWSDVVVLEQGQLTCGTTWHSVGLIGRVRSTRTEMKLVDYSASLYKQWEAEGDGMGWKECGSLNVARTLDRMIALKRQHAVCKTVGVECHVVTPSQIKEICPTMHVDDLQGGLWIPGDGVLTAPDLAQVFSRKAKAKGVQVLEGVGVKKVHTENAKITEVETTLGTIQCEYFVNAAGLWSRELGKLTMPSRVNVPLHACEHYYLVTKPIPDTNTMMPVIRDYDGYVYFREWNGGILAGGFEPNPKPIFHQGPPDRFEFQLLPEDWDHFQILMNEILHRMPVMETAEVRQLVNGPESFTPDSKMLLGESAESEQSGGAKKKSVHLLLDSLKSIKSQAGVTISSLHTDFVCWRGLLTKLLCTPYERQDDWKIAVTRFRGTLYLCEFETDRKRRDEEQMQERQREMAYWGLKFEQYVTARQQGGPPDTDKAVNNNEGFCSVVQTRLQSHSLVYGGEVDCWDGSIVGDNKYVELKTSRTMETQRQRDNFKRFKMLKWWAQSFLLGIRKIVSGFRDDDGVVHSVEDFLTGDIPSFIQDVPHAWQPNVCFNFLHQLLAFLRQHATIDDPRQVYLLQWSPGEDVQLSNAGTQSPLAFLPPWFVNWDGWGPTRSSTPTTTPTPATATTTTPAKT